MNRKVLRLIDANFNRSREGLRVCEDIARFLLDSAELTKKLKAARHAVTGIIEDFTKLNFVKPDFLPFTKFNFVKLTDFRDSTRDVGRASNRKSEMTRLGVGDIFIANIERVKESVRVLEEFFKPIDRKKSAALSRLRFRIYDIEKRSLRKLSSLKKDI